jgi:hypothetical protein
MNCEFCLEPCNPNYICCKICGEDLTNNELIQKQEELSQRSDRI